MSAIDTETIRKNVMEKIKKQQTYLFVKNIMQEAVMRVLDPNSRPFPVLTEQEFISRSIVFHYLLEHKMKAAAEIMQAENYEKFLTKTQLAAFIEDYKRDSLDKHLQTYKPKVGIKLPRESLNPPPEPFNVKEFKRSIPSYQPRNEKGEPIFRPPVRLSVNQNLKKSMQKLQKTLPPTMAVPVTVDSSESEENSVEDEEEAEIQTVPVKEKKTVAFKEESSSSSSESEPESPIPSWSGKPWEINQLSTDRILTPMKTATKAQLPPLNPSTLPPLMNSVKGNFTSIRSLDFGSDHGSSESSDTETEDGDDKSQSEKSEEEKSGSSAHSQKSVVQKSPEAKPKTADIPSSSKVEENATLKNLADLLAPSEGEKFEEIEVDEDLGDLDIDDLLESDKEDSISF